jgi:hypothetical protein
VPSGTDPARPFSSRSPIPKSGWSAFPQPDSQLLSRLNIINLGQTRGGKQAIVTVEKSGLFKLDAKRLADPVGRVKTLGIQDVMEWLGTAWAMSAKSSAP